MSSGRVNTISSVTFSAVELDTGARRELFRVPPGSRASARALGR